MGELLKTLTTDDTDNHVLEVVYVETQFFASPYI